MQRLVEANIKKDTKILDEVLEHLRTMRDAWKEVMRVTCNGSKGRRVVKTKIITIKTKKGYCKVMELGNSLLKKEHHGTDIHRNNDTKPGEKKNRCLTK